MAEDQKQQQSDDVETKDTEQTQNEGAEQNESNQESEGFTMTQSELDSKISKAVDKALNRQAARHAEEIEAARKEGESYAKMTKEERYKKELEDREKKIEEREQAIRRSTLISDIKDDLRDKELPTVFAETLATFDDNEKIKKAVEQIKEDFDSAVDERVKVATRQKAARIDSPLSNTNVNQGTQDIAEMARKARIIK